MLNIGIFELLLIFIVGILFLSHKDLVACIKSIKQLRRKISSMYHKTNEYFQEITEIEEEDIQTLWQKGCNKPNEYIHQIFNHEFLSKEKNLADAKKSNDENLNNLSLLPKTDSKDSPEV